MAKDRIPRLPPQSAVIRPSRAVVPPTTVRAAAPDRDLLARRPPPTPDDYLSRLDDEDDEFLWLEQMTIAGASNTPNWWMPHEDWMISRGGRRMIIRGEILHATNCTVSVMTSPAAEGPWTALYANGATGFGSATRMTYVVTGEPYAQAQAQYYVRVMVQGSTTQNWKTCLRMRATVEGEETPKRVRDLCGDPVGHVEHQPLVSLRGGYAPLATLPDLWVVQEEENYLETTDLRTVIEEVTIMALSGVTLIIEAAMGKEGPWTPCATFTGAGYCFQTLQLTKEQPSTTRLRRVLRYHLEGENVNWSTCFRLNSTVY